MSHQRDPDVSPSDVFLPPTESFDLTALVQAMLRIGGAVNT
jgi:hypothetical protein